VAATISLKVVDLYHGDRVTSFQKAADFGICGIIHKATTGATGKDKKYSDRRAPASRRDCSGEFMTRVAEKLGRKPVFYSGHLIKDRLGNRVDDFWGAHRLWLAHYNANPTVQKSWKKYWLWQYTDGKIGPKPDEVVPGLPGDSSGHLDRDSYEGTRAQLKTEWAS